MDKAFNKHLAGTPWEGILFSHHSVEKVNHVLVSKEELDDIMNVHFYNEKGRDDALAWKAYRTSKLYARSSVLQQWFAVLGWLSPYYSHIRQDTIDNLVEKVEQSVREKKDNAIFISDKQSLLHEKRLGSDVAGVHQVDSKSDNYHGYFGGASTSYIESTSYSSSNDLPLRTHYASPSPDTLLRTKKMRNQVENDAIQNMMKGVDESGIVSQHQMESDDAVRGWFGEQESEGGNRHNNSFVISHRCQDPINEFLPDDKMLACTFPRLFPIGKAYGRRAGNLNGEELNHLLKQFSMIHGQDRRMLGYLADVKRQFAVIKSASLKLSGNSDAISRVNEFMDRNDHQEILKTLQDDPDSPSAKKVWKRLKSTLTLVGGDIAYGALETSKCISQTLETAKRYGAGCTFLTLSLDDMFNTRGIRAAIKTMDNTKFPAAFCSESEYASLDDFVKAIKEHAVDRGQGNINFNEGEGMRFEGAYLSKLATENPAAYVCETKAILHHVLSILVGCPPEGFFGAYDGRSTRKSHYWNTKNCKGIFGHGLGLAGVVEDHMKGTLHFHIIFYGSNVICAPRTMSSVCNLQKALDSFYKAKFSTGTNFQNVLTRTLRKSTALRQLAEPMSSPALLQQTNPIATMDDLSSNGSTMQKMENISCDKRANSEYHVHHRTCHKGFHGRERCRLAKKSGVSNGTNCVLLIPTKQNQPENSNTPSCQTIKRLCIYFKFHP
ncbi:unnamed protein product [Cylindrotheca closterium]|uniref:Uncharacterized protein n=1 Tax=Cylindrotheca closterium TaxID=2856 RepID=A0AAD2FTH5_9STRA|nr:unnamed protein product [Cylindrotheca closterium]